MLTDHASNKHSKDFSVCFNEDEGVSKFDDAWAELTKTVKDQLEKSA